MTPGLIPMISPDGQSGDIPAARQQEAIAAGFKPAVVMTSPDGKMGYVPRERASEALEAGFKVGTPGALAMENPAKTGVLATAGGVASKIGQMVKGAIDNPILVSPALARFNQSNAGTALIDTAANAQQAAATTPQDKFTTPAEKPAMVAGSLLGADTPKLASAIRNRDLGGAVVESTPLIATAAAPEVIRRAAPVAGELATKTADFIKAPSDPNALYNSYLRPSAQMPIGVPEAPKPVMRAVLRDMVAAGDGEAAQRIASGRATVGDLDIARQSANRLARSIYRSPGNYPPGMATGADDFAGAIRDRIYPMIEQSQGLPEGSLQGVKRLQGKLMEAERNPTLTNRLITKGVGAGLGTALGSSVGGWPGGVAGGMLGQAVAEPVAAAAERAVIGAQTKALAGNLPSPGLTPRLGLPTPRIMPAAPEVAAPVANAPAYSNTTRAQRLGLLLPDQTGGPIELPYTPEMTPGEQTAATMQQLRQPLPNKALPAKSEPIRLQPSSKLQGGPQGGHAGNGVASVEELNRPGMNYVIHKNAQVEYHGKSFAPESIQPGSVHVTVLPNGEFRVNAGTLSNTQRAALLRAINAR